MPDPLIEISNIRKRFKVGGGLFAGSGTVVNAVDDVSFQIRHHETLGLVGASGSGKSTVGRIVTNLISPDSGSVTFDGNPISGLSQKAMRPYRRRMQVVFQNPLDSLNTRRTVEENIRRPLDNFNMPRRQANERVREVLEMVGMRRDHASRYPHEFSGGQCQRIAIARALALEPDFILLDEPVSALDVSIRAQILNLLQDLKARLNLTYLFVGHDLSIVRYFSDRIANMYHGRIVEMGPADAVSVQPRHPYTMALQRSVLTLDPGHDQLQEVGGSTTETTHSAAPDIDSACNFAADCPYATAICVKARPILEHRASTDGSVACHHWEKLPSKNNKRPQPEG